MSRDLELTVELIDNLQEIINIHSSYLSDYINLLNRYINYLKKISSLKNERTTLIKYVKKLRYFNNYYTFDEQIYSKGGSNNNNQDQNNVSRNDVQDYTDIGGGQNGSEYEYNYAPDVNESSNNITYGKLTPVIRRISGFNVKVLEILDLLNFQITQSLRNEILSKTLNYDIVLTDVSITDLEDTFRHFVKFNQWFVESLELRGSDPFTLDKSIAIEIVEIARKCAIEDGVDLENSGDILLQEFDVVSDEHEYCLVMKEWGKMLQGKLQKFNDVVERTSSQWHKNK
ncbi:She2p SCDLUD_003996 [Saccharomycodes ludwigii]|nr:hypothetical protein SCDLUD_003996 [Saccharomycodes ludwigii]KAH3899711.1 hypothetical protein SCDLUD_003996 [Saccharomycodes ludwigii]